MLRGIVVKQLQCLWRGVAHQRHPGMINDCCQAIVLRQTQQHGHKDIQHAPMRNDGCPCITIYQNPREENPHPFRKLFPVFYHAMLTVGGIKQITVG